MFEDGYFNVPSETVKYISFGENRLYVKPAFCPKGKYNCIEHEIHDNEISCTDICEHLIKIKDNYVVCERLFYGSNPGLIACWESWNNEKQNIIKG